MTISYYRAEVGVGYSLEIILVKSIRHSEHDLFLVRTYVRHIESVRIKEFISKIKRITRRLK